DPDRGLARNAPRTPHPGPRSRGLARGRDSRRTSRPPAGLRQERAAPGAARCPDLPRRRQARLRRSNPQHPRFRSAPPTRPLGPGYLLRPPIGLVVLMGAGPSAAAPALLAGGAKLAPPVSPLRNYDHPTAQNAVGARFAALRADFARSANGAPPACCIFRPS